MKKRKNKLLNFLKLGTLFFGMILALNSCQKEEEYIVNAPSINLEKAKKMFAAQFNKETFPNLNYNPIWEEAKGDYNNEGDFYLEIPFQNIKQLDIEKGTSYSFDKLIISSKNNDIVFSITHFYGIDIKTNPVNFRNITTKEFYNFSGIITEYNLNREVIKSKFYKNGDDTNSKIKINKDSKKDGLFLSRDDDNGDGEVTILIEYNCLRDCFTILNGQGEIEQYYGCSQWKCSVTSYTILGGGGIGGTITTNSNYINEKIDKIDDSKLVDPKLKCLNKNLTSDGNSFVKNILKNFQGETNVDIVIESKDKVYKDGKEVNATTSPIKDDIITIKIISFRASNHASLEVVRTLIHEYIHADMFRKLNDGSDLHKYPKFKETYDKYKDDKFEPSPQHSTMADLYIIQMRNTLKSYHKNVLTNSYNYISSTQGANYLTDDFYEGLAWRGLKEQNVSAWKEKGNDTIAILNAVNTKYSKLSKTYCPNN